MSIINQTQSFLAIATGNDPAITKLIATGDYITAASDLYAIATLMQIPLEVPLKTSLPIVALNSNACNSQFPVILEVFY